VAAFQQFGIGAMFRYQNAHAQKEI